MKIENSIALVTGANRGLGLAYAKALLAAGAQKVYAGMRDTSGFDVPGLVPVALDITRPASVAAAAGQCSDVSILVNNAGIIRSPSTEEGARAEMETNYFGTLAMCRAFAPVLAANGGGALVNMLSVLSWLSLPGTSGYSASKAAAWSITNGLRHELRAQGTLVIGVHAGYIDTDMARGVNAPKVRPEDVAAQTVAAIEAGHEEVLADALTRQIKAGLGLENGIYLRDL